MSSISFLGCLTPTLTRQQRATVRPGTPQMAPPKSGFDLGVMHGVAVCLAHLGHPPGTWNPFCACPRRPCPCHPSLLTPCSCTQWNHGDQSDQLSHPPFSGRLSCFFVPWAWFQVDPEHPLAPSHCLLGSGHLRQTRVGMLADRIFLEQNGYLPTGGGRA